MFDTMKIAKKIRDTRIEKNMTQMNLADAMGVSYQAVSNWERGNSMPDISKLEDLCSTLDITVTELLGMESKETAAVEKALQQEILTVEELVEVAPMLPPAQVKEQAESKKKKLNLKALEEIAPFMDDDLLEELLEEVEINSLYELCGLAPFLDEDVLDKLVRRAPADDYEGIISLAPFLDEDTMDYLVKRCEGKPDKRLLNGLLPFLSEETVDHIARTCAEEADMDMLEELAPFMEEETIGAVADICIREGRVKMLSALFPFMDDQTLRKVAKALMQAGDLDGLRDAAPFL